MTTAQQVFDIAMGLMSEVNETTGSTSTPDTQEYKSRALLVLNALRGELFPYSDTYVSETSGKRPVCPLITDFTTPIGLDDVIAQTVMPFGLAAHLLVDDSPAVADFFQQRYEELIRTIGSDIPSEFEQIEDMYGISDMGDFGKW